MKQLILLTLVIALFQIPLSHAEIVTPDMLENSVSDEAATKQAAVTANTSAAVDDNGKISPEALFGGGDVGKPFLDAVIQINKVLFESIGSVSFAAGMALFAVFVGASIMTMVAKARVLGGFSLLFGDALEFFFKALIPFTILVYNGTFNNWILDGAYGFAADFMGFGGASGSLNDFPLQQMVLAPVNNFATMMGSGLMVAHEIPFTDGKGLFVPSINLLNIFYAVLAVLLTVAMGFLYFISTILVVGQLIAGMIILPIAIALAPLLSVFIIGWIFSGIFTSWLSFLMLGFFAMMIGGVFIRVFTEFSTMLSVDKFKIVDISKIPNSDAVSVEFLWVNVAALILYSYVMFFLARQVWSIATQLSGGFKLNTGTAGDNGGRGGHKTGGGSDKSSGGTKSNQSSLGTKFGQSLSSPMAAASLPFSASSQALIAASPTLSKGASMLGSASMSTAKTAANVARDSYKSGGQNFKDYTHDGMDAIKNAGASISSAATSATDMVKNKASTASTSVNKWWNSGKY